MAPDRKANPKSAHQHSRPPRDPRERLGAALAQSDTQRARTWETRDALETDRGDPLFPLPDNPDSKVWIVIMLVGLAAAAMALVRFLI
jgi:hypothetical protein